MSDERNSMHDRFTGCLLGLALGDALGAPFEGLPTETITARYPTASHFIASPPEGELWYTDDTQMTIGVAETLISCGKIDEAELTRRFADNYRPQRGYGAGARKVLQAMVSGEDHETLVSRQFPGGSFGNGAAMRVAPVGLFFRHDHSAIAQHARASALPTHVHPLAIEGAQLLALAVGVASTMTTFDRKLFLDQLVERCKFAEFAGPLRRAKNIENRRDLLLFGNGIEATSSVVTSIACFCLSPDSYMDTVANAILLGGDTDTIAAMAGAISGAFLGHNGLPGALLERLEDRHQGRTYLTSLAEQLAMEHLKFIENL
jgi:poly(ADP-ribose) glycohydrolase ARH3